jgi:hypothetical protein
VALEAVIPHGPWGLSWMPYVAGTYDKQLGLHYTFDVPAQAGIAADTLVFTPSTDFWGVQGGLNLIDRGGVKAGISGFYTASADTSTVGGNVFLKIPFGYYPPAGDSGIRAAK